MPTLSTSDESIKKLQAQWKQQKAALETNFQTQLMSMDTTVKNVMQRMDVIKA
jgi:hypothetical protein